VTAYVIVNGTPVEDIESTSLKLNGVPAARWSYDGDTLVAKFDRAALAATVQPGEKVLVALTWSWKDGGTLAATDTIRVISTGR
jgi:hypothetical protein